LELDFKKENENEIKIDKIVKNDKMIKMKIKKELSKVILKQAKSNNNKLKDKKKMKMKNKTD